MGILDKYIIRTPYIFVVLIVKRFREKRDGADNTLLQHINVITVRLL